MVYVCDVVVVVMVYVCGVVVVVMVYVCGVCVYVERVERAGKCERQLPPINMYYIYSVMYIYQYTIIITPPHTPLHHHHHNTTYTITPSSHYIPHHHHNNRCVPNQITAKVASVTSLSSVLCMSTMEPPSQRHNSNATKPSSMQVLLHLGCGNC